MYLSPKLGSEGPQWGPIKLICMSLCPHGRPRRFLVIIFDARNCAQYMRPQSMGSNILSGSLICPFIRPPILSSKGLFAIFVFLLISSLGVQRVVMHLYRQMYKIYTQKLYW